MSSRVLYPPIVDSYMPAFAVGVGNTSYCNVYFRLSKFNASTDFISVHASIVKQDTNMNVVRKVDSNERYRSTGIILNIKPTIVEGEDNLYYIRINSSDLSSKLDDFEGWIPDWTYKIQIRLSSKDYDGSIGQAAWLNANAASFSEWSTICVVKAIRNIDYTIDIFNIDTSNENESNAIDENIVTLYTNTLLISGKFMNCGSENIYSYSFILYDTNDNIIENSGDIYASQYQDNKSFNYLFKNQLENGTSYKVEFKFETINHYIGGKYKYILSNGDESDNRISFDTAIIEVDAIDCYIITAENDTTNILANITSIPKEEEEGRIGLKLYSGSAERFSGNICIRRASAKDNYQIWDDIKIFVVKEQNINDISIYYDYIAESGVWYKYGVQKIDREGNRGKMNITSPVLRNYNYSFLLGKNNQQLKLMFNNSMENFKINMQESQIDPIGAKYPIVTRNAATSYKTFPLNGLITFWMDENNTFCNKKVIYKYEDIVDQYKKYNLDNNITQYDYIYEKDFRNLVLEFLQDGEFKLFKSPTEGNIIVRLMNVSCVPNQSLDRMIYNFTSTALEMAEPTMENYQTYGFYSPGEFSTELTVTTTKLGQIQMNFPIGTNILTKIYQKYDSQGKSLGGYKRVLKNIHHVKITFDEKPLRILNTSEEYVLGNNFILNGMQFSVYAPAKMYEFDERLTFTPIDNLSFLGDAEGKVKTISATIDFLYDIEVETYQAKQVQERTVKTGVGQLFNEYKPGDSLYNEIYYKYYIEGTTTFRRLSSINSIEIEANPGCAFLIKDFNDAEAEKHIINDTGQLRFYQLNDITSIRYLGWQDKEGVLHIDKKADILLNYIYTLTKGTYKG